MDKKLKHFSKTDWLTRLQYTIYKYLAQKIVGSLIWPLVMVALLAQSPAECIGLGLMTYRVFRLLR